MKARADTTSNGRPIDFTVPLETLIEMLREPPSCWIAFGLLGRRDDEASLKLLIGETQGTDEYRRRSAIEAIGSHVLGHVALEVVRELLRDPSQFVVRAAISAAQRLGDVGSHDGIVAALQSSEATTRTSALHALASLWQEQDFERVFDMAGQDAAKQVRREAGWTLRRQANAATWRRLAEHWIDSELPRERVWACELLVQFGSVDDRALVEGLQIDQDGHVRRAAREAIDAIHNQGTRPPG